MGEKSVVIDNIYDITGGQESGVVVYPNGEALICNWSDQSLNGLPHVAPFGGLLWLGETIKLLKTQNKMSWADVVDWAKSDINIIYDRNNDENTLPDSHGIGYEIDTGSTTALVYAPADWC
jgi:hypothetical protein